MNASTIVIESFPALFFYRNSESKRASLVAQTVKNPPAMQAIWVRSLGWEDPLEKGTATHSSSGLENSMDGGAWWATVQRVAESPKQ